MILLVTDFGWNGPYVGQMHAAIRRIAADVPIIDLMHDAPRFAPGAAGELLAALAPALPADATVVAVIDPGVGTARRPVVIEADGRRWIGPDNGLFDPILRISGHSRAWVLDPPVQEMSRTFHGRDLFAPAAARFAIGETPEMTVIAPGAMVRSPVAAETIVYVDDFGNAMTGMADLSPDAVVEVSGHRIGYAETFGAVSPGRPLWLFNSLNRVEICVSQGNAAAELGLKIGDPITIRLPDTGNSGRV